MERGSTVHLAIATVAALAFAERGSSVQVAMATVAALAFAALWWSWRSEQSKKPATSPALDKEAAELDATPHEPQEPRPRSFVLMSGESMEFNTSPKTAEARELVAAALGKFPQCVQLLSSEGVPLDDNSELPPAEAGDVQVLCCQAPVGLAAGSARQLPDWRFSCSSRYEGCGNIMYQPFTARLHIQDRGWAPETRDMLNGTSWLQVDLGRSVTVMGVATQGSGGHQEWTTRYKVAVSDDAKSWQSALADCGGEVFDGNEDTTSVVKHTFESPLRGRYVRFLPTAYKAHVTIRAEIFVG